MTIATDASYSIVLMRQHIVAKYMEIVVIQEKGSLD